MQTEDEYEAKHSRKQQDVHRVLRHSKKDRRKRNVTSTRNQRFYESTQDCHLGISVHCQELSMNRQESSEEEDLNQRTLLNTASSKFDGKRFTYATGVIPKTMNAYKHNNHLAKSITPSELLHVTPHKMIQCNLAQPKVDMNMYSDLLRAFNYPSMENFKKMMKILETLPYNRHSETNQLFDTAMHHFREYSADSNQYRRLLEIRQKILERSSYGLLLIYNGRLFVLRSTSKHRCLPIIKSHPIIKDDGQLESPRETAVRVAYKAIEYWEVNTGEWRAYNIEEHSEHIRKSVYMECTVEHEINRQKCYRLIGLFVIRLSTEIQFRALHLTKLQVNGEWIPLDADIDQKEYYQLYPFIEYLRNHIGVLLD
ncbi:unnamed protein product [Rotaria socialis]|uniref:Uncharacterized protein n=1 Tax=Rotaria socialis TaxID=392032 RepID=A0A820URN8_9BILA|nr:unnamed protein product [Rotaria socialis]CAF3403222.1 unnamed protein product [Rotaria socialis]CAF3542128.1 unnamed protein product [Rotaria socialis]CAF4115197.1 unnamed protein product [Rotaria socialis]CAF4489310.1 unnamed protein product [Rotaria socialis]